jgi:hypothetical protein
MKFPRGIFAVINKAKNDSCGPSLVEHQLLSSSVTLHSR